MLAHCGCLQCRNLPERILQAPVRTDAQAMLALQLCRWKFLSEQAKADPTTSHAPAFLAVQVCK